MSDEQQMFNLRNIFADFLENYLFKHSSVSYCHYPQSFPDPKLAAEDAKFKSSDNGRLKRRKIPTKTYFENLTIRSPRGSFFRGEMA